MSITGNTWLDKADAQVQLVIDAFAESGTRIGVSMTPHGVGYLYEEGYLLVRDMYLSLVREIAGGGYVAEGLLGGVSRFCLEGAPVPKAAAALDLIDARLGPGIATPNHIMSVAPGQLCPACEPDTVDAGSGTVPPVRAGNGGTGVSVRVLDTGLLPTAQHPWLAGVTGDSDLTARPGRIQPYAGHGTFVAGTVRCVAPRADVHVSNVFSVAGACLESDLVRRLDSVLGSAPDVITLSAGGTTRLDMPPLGFAAFLERYRQQKGTVLVAAAGNNAERRPFWPAACPEVVSVGALGADGRGRASFSGFGSWIDVYAPGENLVNAFASGRYTCTEPPLRGQEREFRGMARWSGTSFAAPLVAGLIADRMSRTGARARDAADELLRLARECAIAGVGPILVP
jgi:subtilisin family serine protease